MPDNEELERNNSNNTPAKVAADQAKQAAKKQAGKVVGKAASNAVRAWLLPILPWILAIVICLIVVVGVIMFFLSGVGLVFDSIKTATDNFGNKVKSWWYGGQQYLVTEQEIINVADKLESMGYDLKGDGFLSEVIPPDGEVKSDGLTRPVDEANAAVDASGIARDEKGITNIKSDYLKQYLVSSNYMYTLYNTNDSRYGKSGFIKLYEDDGVIGNKGKLYAVNSPIVTLVKSILSLQFGLSNSTIQIDINTQDKTLEIANVEGIFWWKKVNTFKYNLDGWTGRYGMPLEFLLSVHLASMQPDLAYDMTQEFQTNVNMLLHPVKSTIIGHISIDGEDITSGSATLNKEEWEKKKKVKGTVKDPDTGKDVPVDAEGNPVEPNGFDTHNREAIIKDLAKIDNSFNMYFPYIGDVTDHWFRNTYFTINDYSLNYIKNDQEFEYYTGERWTEYETETDENGNIVYSLYEVNPDGSLGSKYNGSIDQAVKEGVKVSKKAKTGTILEKSSDEFVDGTWSAYDVEYNAVLISNTPITPDVVDDYDSITYKDEMTYEARTSEALRQIRDGERGETNSKIKKMLTQYSYYTYDGQRERADSILADKDVVGEYKHEDANGNIIDGTTADKRNQNLVGKFKINAEALSAFKILENMNTMDADEVYRDFKELIVELNYFDKEDFAGNATNVFQWPVPDCATAGWPVREFEKIENVYGTLIDSRTNLLNLKNLFLQYRHQDEEDSEKEKEQTNNTPTKPEQEVPDTQYDISPDAATTDRNGNALVDENGNHTEAWDRMIEEEERRIKERREREGYVPGELDKPEKSEETEEDEDAVQGKSEERNGGGDHTDYEHLTQDFINAEDESGAEGWYDTYDIVSENLGYDHKHCPYAEDSEREYMSFLYGLGGVFAEYAGDENNGEGTYEDFVAACQYVYGLATMFGFEYCNGKPERCDPYQYGIYTDAFNSPNDAYYEVINAHSHNSIYGGGSGCDGFSHRLMDDTMIAKRYVTNCNFTTDKVFYKAGLFDRSDGSDSWGPLIAKYNGNYVYRTEDLQVGDLIEQFDGGGWTHVSFVGEVNDDEIVIYETGHGFINEGNFRFTYNRFTDKPTWHESWFGVHLFDLQPKKKGEYEGYDGNVAVVSPITGEVIDAGEIEVINEQTNEPETVGYVKIRALVPGDIGTSIPDTDIKNMENPETKVPRLKDGSEAEQLEYHYGGYKLFLQEYEHAKVTGFVLYMEGFDLRLFEKDGSGKVKLQSRRKIRIYNEPKW